MTSSRRTRAVIALLVAVGLVAVTTLMATAARAIGTGRGNSLKIAFCDNSSWEDDFATADPVVEVVKVAKAIPHEGDDGYDYDFAAMGFEGITVPAEPGEGDWQKATDQVAALVTEDTERVTLRGTDTATDLEDGLYLLLIHDGVHQVAYGTDVESSLIADTAGWSYSFRPVLVALPSRSLAEDGFTDWTQKVTATMKPTRSPGEGSIRIDKSVQGFDGKQATLVFHVVGTDRNGIIRYDERRSLTIPAGDGTEAHGSVVIGDIPTDLTVSVTEEYAGAGYELVDAKGPESPVTTRGGQPAFSFTNRKSDESETGNGVTNRFVYDEDGNRDWTWHADGQDEEGSKQ